MKKIIATIIMVIITLGVYAGNKNIICKVIYPREGNTFVNDSIEVKISPSKNDYISTDGYFLYLSIKNKTKDRIYIEWSNLRIDGHTILFEDDNLLTYRNKKEDEAIPSSVTTDEKCIARGDISDYGESLGDRVRQIFYPKEIKRGDSAEVDLIVPIKFSTKTIDYKIKIEIFCVDKNGNRIPKQ